MMSSSCSVPHTSFPIDKVGHKLLVVDTAGPRIIQVHADIVSKMFSMFRDFHNQLPWLSPYIHLANLVASVSNASVMCTDLIKNCYPGSIDVPVISFTVSKRIPIFFRC